MRRRARAGRRRVKLPVDVTPKAAKSHRYPTGAVLRRYVPGPGVDEPLVWYEGSGTGDRRWLHADERGSVIAVSDGAGTALAINRYDEYGIPQSGNAGRFQYTGQAWLPELGMYYYKARMYSPTLGRFLQTDPIGYGDGLNWYNYVSGDPINRTDPSGMTDRPCQATVQVCTPVNPGGITVTGNKYECKACNSEPSLIDRFPTLPGDLAGRYSTQNDGFGDIVVVATLSRSKNKPQSGKDNSASSCLLSTAKTNGAALALDTASVALNFVPGGTAAKFTAGLALGAVGMANSIGGMSPTRQGLNGASIGAGISGMLAGAADPAGIAFPGSKAVAAVSFFGKALGVTSLAIDGYQAYLDYQECRSKK